MTDVADDIRKAVNQQPRPPKQMVVEDDYMKLRAHVRGTLIAAKRQMVPGDEWLVTDDRILDIVSTWLESQRR